MEFGIFRSAFVIILKNISTGFKFFIFFFIFFYPKIMVSHFVNFRSFSEEIPS